MNPFITVEENSLELSVEACHEMNKRKREKKRIVTSLMKNLPLHRPTQQHLHRALHASTRHPQRPHVALKLVEAHLVQLP